MGDYEPYGRGGGGGMNELELELELELGEGDEEEERGVWSEERSPGLVGEDMEERGSGGRLSGKKRHSKKKRK